MTIRLTGKEFDEQYQDAGKEKQWDPTDKLDITCKFDARISQGWSREIYLREGIWLMIDSHQPIDKMVVTYAEEECYSIECSFVLSGKGERIFNRMPDEKLFLWTAGKYFLRSNGLLPQSIGNYLDKDSFSIFEIHITPSVLYSFAASLEDEMPENLQHFIKSPSQEAYLQSRDIQPMMKTVIQQVLHCPYQGMVKRMYVESKVVELMSLVLNHEVTIQQGEVKQGALKIEQLERIHYAKEILLRDLDNPPSLGELARQVGLNDCLLKSSFRHVFGTTVFGMLKSYRLELARQLLSEQDINIAEVAHRVGYGSSTTFGRAFKQKFGVTPKSYQKASR